MDYSCWTNPSQVVHSCKIILLSSHIIPEGGCVVQRALLLLFSVALHRSLVCDPRINKPATHNCLSAPGVTATPSCIPKHNPAPNETARLHLLTRPYERLPSPCRNNKTSTSSTLLHIQPKLHPTSSNGSNSFAKVR